MMPMNSLRDNARKRRYVFFFIFFSFNLVYSSSTYQFPDLDFESVPMLHRLLLT
jgi:hypothetical protein